MRGALREGLSHDEQNNQKALDTLTVDKLLKPSVPPFFICKLGVE